jgi:hypothetical protein
MSVVSVLYQGVSGPDVEDWHLIDDLPDKWIHTGGGLCRFVPGILDMNEEYEGPWNEIDEACVRIDAHFKRLKQRGVILRYILINEKWSFHNGGFSKEARDMVVRTFNL